MNEQILNIIKTLQSITDDTQDNIISIYIDMAIQSILNYCNLNELPEELIYVVADMVISEMKANGKFDNETPVSSISEGERSVSFNNNILQLRFSDRVRNITQLNGFRQLYKL